MNALGKTPNGEIVTVMNKEAKWEAAIVQDLDICYSARVWSDTKEAALETLLGFLSCDLYRHLPYYQE
jgi:hypothetical protein